MKVTVMGSGSSFGTPAAGGFWGSCDPNEPKNARTRASILVDSGETTLLVDTTPDLRQHMNRFKVQKLDGILLSHAHSDHINGTDDLRPITFYRKQPIDIYSNEETLAEVGRRWPYVFKAINPAYYSAFGAAHVISPGERRKIGDIEFDVFAQDHKVMTSLGFRFGDFAYSVDVADLDEAALETLKGVKIWLVDANAYHKETIGTHANLKRVMEWVDRLKPEMTYLTVLSSYMDYQTLCTELPAHVRPAYDGLIIEY